MSRTKTFVCDSVLELRSYVYVDFAVRVVRRLRIFNRFYTSNGQEKFVWNGGGLQPWIGRTIPATIDNRVRTIGYGNHGKSTCGRRDGRVSVKTDLSVRRNEEQAFYPIMTL